MEYIHWMLNEINPEILAEWYDQFNSWKYPADFPIRAPEDWDNLPLISHVPTERTKYTTSWAYMRAIESIIGFKECLRYHHIHNLGVSNVQYNVWWAFSRLNETFRILFPNFYFDVYGFMDWRYKKL